MNSYYVTFGNKYRTEPHPSGIVVNPDGYVTIRAESTNDAYSIALKHFGFNWGAMHYNKETVDKPFPVGSFLELVS